MPLTLADILLPRNPIPPPPVGAGRTHRLEDKESEIPPQEDRFRDILEAVSFGATSHGAILRQLPQAIPKALLITDCEELVERKLLKLSRNSKTATRFYLPE